MMGKLGRNKPKDRKHVEKYPYSALRKKVVANVENVLALPSWHWTHDQGAEGSCVGHGIAMERAITNTIQNRVARVFFATRRYDPIDVWNHAKELDADPMTNPGDDQGTTVAAGYAACMQYGLSRVQSMVLKSGVPTPLNPQPDSKKEGISTYRWATSVDDIRTALSEGIPVAIGVNWYNSFDTPILDGGEYWIGSGSLGKVRGGHCVCIYGASDSRHAFKVKNSWGRSYPLVWLTYQAMSQLLDEEGEAALVVDL